MTSVWNVQLLTAGGKTYHFQFGARLKAHLYDLARFSTFPAQLTSFI